MQKSLCLLLFLYFGLSHISTAQSPQNAGITFFKGDWKSLLNESDKRNKLIFVDVYTDWCPPCKRMDKEVFPLAEVGNVYNEFFVNYKLNAEVGEGIELAKKYAIKAYPTYLFIDGKGILVYRTGDYMKAADFIDAARKAIAKKDENGSLASLEADFKNGNRQLSFLKTLLEKRTSLQLDNADILNAYISALPPQQLHTPQTLKFLSNHLGGTVSDALPVLFEGISKLNTNDQQQIAEKIYRGVLYSSLGIALKEERFTDAGKIMADLEKIRYLLPEKTLASVDNLSLHYFYKTKDTAGLKKIGYQMASKQISIPVDTIRKKDRVLFEEIMQPFFSGKQDSTKIPGFSEEKKLVQTQYSGQIAGTLHTIADAFNSTLDPKDKALNDALEWIKFAILFHKNESLLKLKSELEDKIRNNQKMN